MAELIFGDCLHFLGALPDGIDSVVTDPPYGLSFMGKGWDHAVPGVEYWHAILRAAKPGAHLLAFGGTRTFHRLACAIEDAGWELRDCLMWVYGSGMPKSLNLKGEHLGRGTCLKPSWEPIILARKPLAGTVSHNVSVFGTGALNINGCRVEYQSEADKHESQTKQTTKPIGGFKPANYGIYGRGKGAGYTKPAGRWPANLIHDGSEEVLAGFPVSTAGSATRLFYCAKASRSERGEGNTHPTVKPLALMRYLCRLITPVGGVVLDPFMGSGSTGVASLQEGFEFVGIELDQKAFKIASQRISEVLA